MSDHGTRIIIYNLWEDDQGLLELDFDSDPHVCYQYLTSFANVLLHLWLMSNKILNIILLVMVVYMAYIWQDIQLRGVNRDEKNIQMAREFPNSRHFLTYRHSLRVINHFTLFYNIQMKNLEFLYLFLIFTVLFIANMKHWLGSSFIIIIQV